MTSSSKKKKDKKKDFQVRIFVDTKIDSRADITTETKVEGWQRQAKGSEWYRHKFQSQM